MYLSHRCRISPEHLKTSTIKLLEDFDGAIRAASAEDLDAHPVPGKWSATEIAFHAASVCRSTLKIADGLRNGQEVPDIPDSAAGRTKQASQTELLEASKRTLEMAQDFDYNFSGPRCCSHPWFGSLSSRQWLVVNLIHLERHYLQLQRITQV